MEFDYSIEPMTLAQIDSIYNMGLIDEVNRRSPLTLKICDNIAIKIGHFVAYNEQTTVLMQLFKIVNPDGGSQENDSGDLLYIALPVNLF